MVRRRSFSIFSLSFLDSISCGFGAVILLFVLVNANAARNRDELTKDLRGEVSKIEVEILKLEKEKVLARNALEEVVEETAETQGLSREIIRLIEESKEELARQDGTTLATKEHVNQLKTDLLSLEAGIKRLKAGAASEDPGESLLAFAGDGRRQYLTGLQLKGARTLILVDASASMLGETVVDVLRIRNLPREEQKSAPKWIQARRTVDWLLSQIPSEGEFQVVVYNQTAASLFPKVGWASAGDSELRKQASESLAEMVPEGGTSLFQAFTFAGAMSPPPDNIILLADGLPTMSASAPTIRKRVSGTRRVNYFDEAVRQLPGHIPVNTLLFYMEGDPMAALSYWRLAVKTGGSFLSVTQDWP
ncbi:VWA domain-containing protein [Kiritimatiellaeota bacterium B1221]|nr:VWA domain-containing protein [Kiritimatiellaeota bacterium B1221]